MTDAVPENNIVDNGYNKKYQVILDLVNKILTNINKPVITDLKEFIDINKNDIATEINKNLILSSGHIYFDNDLFDRIKFNWSRRRSTLNYILTFLRYACAELNLSFVSKQKLKSVRVGEESYLKMYTMYSIVDKKETKIKIDEIKEEIKQELKQETDEIKEEIKQELKQEIKEELNKKIKRENKRNNKRENKQEAKQEIKQKIKQEIKEELKKEIKRKTKKETTEKIKKD